MNIRKSLALAGLAVMLTASLALARGSAPATATATAKGGKPAATAPAKPAAAAPAKPAVTAAAATLVDLNSATRADLMKLPGVGEAISAKIIAGRPWSNKAQLLAKGLVSKPVYDRLSPLVIAKQAAAK